MARETAPKYRSHSYFADHLDWKAAIWAGVIAGVISMAVETPLLMFFMDQSPWALPRMNAAMVLGNEVLPPPASFDIGIMTIAMLIHFSLSILYGLFLGWLVHHMNRTGTLLVGSAFGLVIYFFNLHLVAPTFFPWFIQAQNWISFISHLIYGMVLGISYVQLRRRHEERYKQE